MENLNELIKALSKVQSNLEHVKRDTKAFNYMYATLDQCWNTIKKPLTDNGLCLIQLPYNEEDKIGIRTLLMHSSGGYLESSIAVKPIKNDPQTMGSLITYLRRYSLMAVIGLSPEDDDGEKAMPDTETKPIKKIPDTRGSKIYGFCECESPIYLSNSGNLYCSSKLKTKEWCPKYKGKKHSGEKELPIDVNNYKAWLDWKEANEKKPTQEDIPF